MCTAIAYKHLFGRNLDLEYGYQEQVVILPRRYPLNFRMASAAHTHHAMIGIAAIDNGYPLFFDAMNEHGLCIAGLDFPNNAHYPSPIIDRINIAPFEMIPWILSQCATVDEAIKLIRKTHLADIAYSDQFPQSPLHWLLADKQDCIVLEQTIQGMHIYKNPVGVLCNNPPFPYHMQHLSDFQHLSPGSQERTFEGLSIQGYSGGMGAIGLPGDFSSASRFIKATFVKQHSHCGDSDKELVTQYFHLLNTVAMPRGAIRVNGGQDEITQYSSCCDMNAGIYYYTTYENSRIQAVTLHAAALDKNALEAYPLLRQQDIFYRN